AGGLIAVTYPWLKRVVHVPQFYMGVAFGWSIPMAFAAQTGAVPQVGWLLFVAVVLWAALYDTMYAMVDRDDDLKIGIKTSAITFGRYDVTAVMLSYAATLAILAWVGVQAGRGIYFHVGLAAAAGMMAWHYTLIRGRQRDKCFKVFMNNNWVGAVIFAGLATDYYFSPMPG
ncbi:MAG: 4-hydroxybenzoate octaprenyltransferase, partial [Pseudomonadota bacterium]